MGIFGRKIQVFQALLEPSSTSVDVKEGSTLLQAALDAGINYPHRCRVGSCKSCKSFLIKGKIKELSDTAYVLSDEDIQAGAILACQTLLKSDIRVSVKLHSGGLAG